MADIELADLGSVIKTAYEGQADTNAFLDAEKTKLTGIETAATADQTGAQIKALYEVEPNAFTDTQFTKLAGIATGAEVNTVDTVNGATGTVVIDADDVSDTATTNKYTTAGDITKLGGIEALADVTDEANVTAALDGATLVNVGSPVGTDLVIIQDASDSKVLKTVLFSAFSGGGISGIGVEEEGSAVVTSDTMNFIGSGVTATDIGGVATITIAAGAAPIDTVFGRTGTVVAVSGDYTASEVTNAFDTTGNTLDDITTGITNKHFTTTDETKLDGIEANATADTKASEAEVFTGTDDVKFVTSLDLKPREFIAIAPSDETTDLTTGTAKATFRMPYAFELSDIRASVTTAPTGSVLTVDVNEGGATILSTKITIDASEKTSTTAATAPVISDTTLADDAEITIDIDGVGSTIAGAGLKVYLIGNRT